LPVLLRGRIVAPRPHERVWPCLLWLIAASDHELRQRPHRWIIPRPLGEPAHKFFGFGEPPLVEGDAGEEECGPPTLDWVLQ